MRMCDVVPYIRFAQTIFLQPKPVTVNVFDCRIFCVASGTVEIFIENQHYVLPENSLFYCPAGSIYSLSSINGCSLHVLNFDLSQKRNNVINHCSPVQLSKTQRPCFKNEFIIDDCTFFNNCFLFEKGAAFCNTIKETIEEFSTKKIFYQEKCSSVIKKMLIDIYRASLSNNKDSYTATKHAIHYIKENYMHKISNDDISKVVGYHEYHINRLFLKHTGMTIHQYIIETRIAAAKNLLLNSDIPIYQIAESTGFHSSSHFVTCFKKISGCSPTAYKNIIKNNI